MDFAEFMRELSRACLAANVPAVSPETGAYLADLARRHGTRHILEIGTAHGYSTLCLAHAMWAEGHVTTIEFSAPSYERALAHFADSGIADRITAIFGDARRVIADLPAESWFDAAFVDGEKRRTVEFLDAVWPLVRPGGWIVVDDAIKFRWKMEGLDDWLARSGAAYELVRTDPDDGVLVILRPA